MYMNNGATIMQKKLDILYFMSVTRHEMNECTFIMKVSYINIICNFELGLTEKQ
jgi:hypothetical protein